MSGFDGESVSSVSLGPPASAALRAPGEITSSAAGAKFRAFLRTHKDDNQAFIYRDKLLSNYKSRNYSIEVDFADIRSFDSQLATLLHLRPLEFLPIFERSAREVVQGLTVPAPKDAEMHNVQVMLRNFGALTSIRSLNSTHVAQLVEVRGVCTSAQKPRIKAMDITIMCRNCKQLKHIHNSSGFGSVQLPRRCDTMPPEGQDVAKCPLDPYVILADDSTYVDTQTMKLQENPETIPTGEMPRSITLSAERYLVGSVKPGTRVTITGIFTTYQSRATGRAAAASKSSDPGVRLSYLRVIGIEQESQANDFMLGKFNPEDEEEMVKLSHEERLRERIAQSLAPAIMERDDIKRAIACCLFGGSRKMLPDGMRLRGDINVLLLGDPSVAKSQFLKFAAQAAPIAVYTSGKGSSAAGLTASVLRDATTGEFYLEGGALVLADGGLVCIDEFDKMREQDRVAIHEAMEQQTISIAKAGITTILNSRTAVLAAANPHFGRYDDMKTATENIDFQASILSRFDLIFIIRDQQDELQDRKIAAHIINVHKKVDAAINEARDDLIPLDQLRRYIAYSRQIQPRLSDDAAKLLADNYVTIRKEMADRKREERKAALDAATAAGGGGGAVKLDGGSEQVIPITVRQLEAVIRLSESLARMELQEAVNVEHVHEALRLFKVATLQAATSPSLGGFEATSNNPLLDRKIKDCERWVEGFVSYGTTASTREVLRQALASGHEEHVAVRALHFLVSRGSFQWLQQKKQVKRIMA